MGVEASIARIPSGERRQAVSSDRKRRQASEFDKSTTNIAGVMEP